MADEVVIRASRPIVFFIVALSMAMIVFMFWLGLSSSSMTGLVPSGMAIIWCGIVAAIIKQPFQLVIDDNGLFIRTPFEGSFFAWESFQQFYVKRADPWTTYVAYKLKPDVKSPWYYRLLSPGRREGRLFPYFELRNEELLLLLRKHQYKGRSHLIL